MALVDVAPKTKAIRAITAASAAEPTTSHIIGALSCGLTPCASAAGRAAAAARPKADLNRVAPAARTPRQQQARVRWNLARPARANPAAARPSTRGEGWRGPPKIRPRPGRAAALAQ